MERATELAQYVSDVLIVALAIVAVMRWRRERDDATAWFAITFVTIAFVVIAGLVTPRRSTSEIVDWVRKVEVCILVLFPYSLYRFTATFLPRIRPLRVAALVVTAGIMVWTLLLPSIPIEGQPTPRYFGIYVIGLLLQWSSLSLLAAARLWLAGAGQPSVARTRMRLLSLGAFGLTIALVLAGAATSEIENYAITFTVQIIGVLSILGFFFGFAPPGWMRTVWRRRESEALQRAISGLMASKTPTDVATRILPHVVEIMGARGTAVLDGAGGVIASEALTEDEIAGIKNQIPEDLEVATHTRTLLVLPFEFGTLVVWASPYTPFFGREEVGLITSLGALTDVAMERASLFSSLEEAHRALATSNKALAHREAMLAQAQKISKIGSWEWDPQDDRFQWSDEMYRIFGLEPSTFEGTKDALSTFIHPDDREPMNRVVEEAMGSRDGYDIEYRLIRPSGEVVSVHSVAKIERDRDGKVARMFGVVHDVTERKRSEQALADAFAGEREARMELERLNNEMETFVYTVSHDLNSPLVSVLGYVDLLKEDFGDRLPDEAKFYLERIRSSSSFMRSLINDLLELSRVGRVQTEIEDVSVTEVVDEITGELKSAYPEVEFDVLQPLPTLRINRLRARQLFSNLMSNAVKYGGRSDVHVRVAAERSSNGEVILSVADDGPGIPREHRERVFRVFERLSGDKEGTGMGLAVCKRIVEAVGGRIWIEDSEAGTDMRMALPVSVRDNDRERAS